MAQKTNKSLRFLVTVCVASDPRAGIFNFLFFVLLNDVQLQPKLLDRLEFCRAVPTFSHRGMNVCPICEASLSHHTLYMGNLVPAYTMYHVFPCWPPKKDWQKKMRQRTDFEAD